MTPIEHSKHPLSWSHELPAAPTMAQTGKPLPKVAVPNTHSSPVAETPEAIHTESWCRVSHLLKQLTHLPDL